MVAAAVPHRPAGRAARRDAAGDHRLHSADSRIPHRKGAIIGLAGSLAGAALGLGAVTQLAGQYPAALYVNAAAAIAGSLFVTTTAALLPAQALRRLLAAHLLAEE
jgi:hypothetical protein